MQVTSDVPASQQMTITFTNNNLCGHSGFVENYRTSKARVCVTVGMMTTGYDCPDILNLALMRPIFSPSDFVQMNGRGTRKHNFTEELFDPERQKRNTASQQKRRAKARADDETNGIVRTRGRPRKPPVDHQAVAP